MKNLLLITGAALLLSATPTLANQAATSGQAAAAPTADLLATAAAKGQFTTLAKAITAAGMADQFQSGEFVTVFAPTDAAFAALPAGAVDSLLKPENQAQLKALLANHVVPGYANSEFLAKQSNSVMNTLGQEKLAISSADGKVTVSGAHVVTADVRATNGLLHGIDKVLMPAEPAAPMSDAAPTGAD